MTLELFLVGAVILIGIVFLLIEIFLLPGVSLAGIAGGILIAGGVAYAYIYIGTATGNTTLAFAALAIGVAFIQLVRSKSLRKIALNTSLRETVDNSELQKIAVGDHGKAVSRLNPMGKVIIHDTMVEAKSYEGEMIDEDSEVEVVQINSSNILVKKLTK